jgi:SAM-dependent methyltransferase
MRPWYKYELTEPGQPGGDRGIDATFADHEKAMRGYRPDEAYRDREAFFQKYLREFQDGRLAFYDSFLKSHLAFGVRILSLGSGRCANELALLEKGYDVTCSDLERFEAYPQTKELFPRFVWEPLNILNGPAPSRYGAVISLSMIYLFDDAALDRFFQHCAQSLEDRGHLLLDSAGSPDNRLAWLILNVLLPLETQAKRLLFFMIGRGWRGIVRKHHGYRRTDQEIIEKARRQGFILVAQVPGAFLNEFRRS